MKQKKVHQPNEIAPTISLWYTANQNAKKYVPGTAVNKANKPFYFA